MPVSKSAFVIAGTDSGSGKTTVTLALLAALSNRGLKIQAFKAGPDYIDPTYHDFVVPSQRSRNLDLWLCPENQVKYFFERGMENAEVGVVEGVMGLFDGKVEKGLDTSTASLAKKLGLPVILVIDASGMAQSVAAVVHGFLTYDPGVNLAGIIFNRVGGEGHYQFLKQIVESKFPVKCFGFLPKDPDLGIPERHLGLVPSLENSMDVNKFAAAGSKYFDIDGMLRTKVSSVSSCDFSRYSVANKFAATNTKSIRLGLAYDAAFHFYYEDALDAMREEGFEIVKFSPLKSEKLPEDLDALYFGGGFPEVFSGELAKNKSMVQSVRQWAEDKKPIFAECGGLIYLVNTGIIPGSIRMTDRLQNFGYKEIQFPEDNFLFSKNTKVRVHEFHYSVWDGGDGQVFWNGNILASYYHVHLGAYPQAIRRLYEISAHKNLHPVR